MCLGVTGLGLSPKFCQVFFGGFPQTMCTHYEEESNQGKKNMINFTCDIVT